MDFGYVGGKTILHPRSNISVKLGRVCLEPESHLCLDMESNESNCFPRSKRILKSTYLESETEI